MSKSFTKWTQTCNWKLLCVVSYCWFLLLKVLNFPYSGHLDVLLLIPGHVVQDRLMRVSVFLPSFTLSLTSQPQISNSEITIFGIFFFPILSPVAEEHAFLLKSCWSGTPVTAPVRLCVAVQLLRLFGWRINFKESGRQSKQWGSDWAE